MVPILSISISVSFVGKLGQRLLYPLPPTRLCCEFSSAEGISAADAGDRRDFATISKPSTDFGTVATSKNRRVSIGKKEIQMREILESFINGISFKLFE